MMQLSFCVPGPPIGKMRARVVRSPKTGRVRGFTPTETVEYEKLIGMHALAERSKLQSRGQDAWPLGAEYEVEIVIYFATKDGDADNVLKSVLDGCEAVLWRNDKQVRRAWYERFWDDPNPRIEVRVEALL